MTMSSSRTLLALLCASLVFVRAADVHLHLCLDGQEAPRQVHVADSGLHADDEHAGQQHEDRDVDLGGALAKTAKVGIDLPLFLIAALTLFLMLAAFVRVPHRSNPLGALSRAHYLLPPLRGPPALAS